MTQTQLETAATTAPRWWERRMTAFDVETTGVDYETDRIVTASVASVGGGSDTDTRSWLINPGVEIPEGAARFHGITTEKAAAEGVDPVGAIDEIVSGLHASLQAGFPIVAFNARFDLTMLDRDARRHGIEPLTDRLAGGRHLLLVLDPYVLDKHLDAFRPGKRHLEVMCAHYGAKLSAAHDADADAVAAARIAWAIGAKGVIKRRSRNVREMAQVVALEEEWAAVRGDLELLHAAQVRWAAEQAIGLRAYFASKGDPQHVEPSWPIVPVPA